MRIGAHFAVFAILNYIKIIDNNWYSSYLFNYFWLGIQWGKIALYSGKGKIILPISAKVYVIVLQHYGLTPQYNGVDITQNVSSSLEDEEEIRFIAITK